MICMFRLCRSLSLNLRGSHLDSFHSVPWNSER
jgi:hypothetical protein